MERLGRGKGVAALLNGRARQVTPAVVQALVRALPEAQVLVSEDLAQARRHADTIVRSGCDLVLCGGGDGSMVKLLNLLREAGASPLPAVGILRLGTGNGWARTSGAPPFSAHLGQLAALPRALPTDQHDLVEVEGTLCHFTGVGWDAKLLNDYLRNLDARSSQLVGSAWAARMHKGLGGYLYSVFRYTIPEEYALLRRSGPARVRVENLGPEASTLTPTGQVVPIPDSAAGAAPRTIYEGPFGIACAGSVTEWGYGFKAFPRGRALPRHLNLRVYERSVLEASRRILHMWRGRLPEPGMLDLFCQRVRLHFSRPVAFQIGGDGEGLRESLELRVAAETVRIVDWTRALGATPG